MKAEDDKIMHKAFRVQELMDELSKTNNHTKIDLISQELNVIFSPTSEGAVSKGAIKISLDYIAKRIVFTYSTQTETIGEPIYYTSFQNFQNKLQENLKAGINSGAFISFCQSAQEICNEEICKLSASQSEVVLPTSTEEFLKQKDIKDTLFVNGEWIKGGLSQLISECTGNNLRELYLLLDESVKAICFTRDYVEPKVSLPPIQGWSWFDICKKIEKIIPDSKWIKEFNKRCVIQSQLSPSPSAREVAVEFVLWINKNNWHLPFPNTAEYWSNGNETKTNEELYDLFKQTKNNK